MASVVSINVGKPSPATWAGLGYTSMRKRSIPGPVWVGDAGISGDQISDTKHHGGVDQAVYAFAREDLDWWAAQLDREIPDGTFAENLTTQGLDVNEALVGERWRIGGAVLEVASVRTPCNDFKNWMGLRGYDNTTWVKRFTQVARPGPYLRVIEEGEVSVGDTIEVVHRPDHDVSVSLMFRALNTDRSLLPRLAVIDNLAVTPAKALEEYLRSQ